MPFLLRPAAAVTTLGVLMLRSPPLQTPRRGGRLPIFDTGDASDPGRTGDGGVRDDRGDDDPRRALREACGMVTVYAGRTDRTAPMTFLALQALQHRGREGAGLVSQDTDGTLHLLRGRGLIAEVLSSTQAAALPGSRALGHVRYSIVADEQPQNLQPFVRPTPWGTLGLSHNGNLRDAPVLSTMLRDAGEQITTTMDSELLAHLLARALPPADSAPGRRLTLDELATAAARAYHDVQGAFSLTLMLGDQLCGVRDRWGIRPLCVGQFPTGGLIIASETCALQAAGAQPIYDVAPGELVAIGEGGLQTRRLWPPAAPAPCVFELIYFARPDSRVFGVDVQATRQRLGQQLARELSDDDEFRAGGDGIVVPVPESGVAAATGLAHALGLPLLPALRQVPDIGRTFLLPSEDLRDRGVRSKLYLDDAGAAHVRGRHVILVDDSLVRGHTAQQVVAQMRAAGARRVTLAIASPPIAWPCYLGIDMPEPGELIINAPHNAHDIGQDRVAAIASRVGADRLRYLSLAGLQRAVGGDAFCFGCMTGRYPL